MDRKKGKKIIKSNKRRENRKREEKWETIGSVTTTVKNEGKKYRNKVKENIKE